MASALPFPAGQASRRFDERSHPRHSRRRRQRHHTRGLPQAHTGLPGPGAGGVYPSTSETPTAAGQEAVPFPEAEVMATPRAAPPLHGF